MKSVRVTGVLLLYAILLAAIIGCGGSGSSNKAELPDDLPVPILEKALDVEVLSEQGLFEITYQVAGTIENTADRYRQILKEKQFLFQEWPGDNEILFTVSAKSKAVQLNFSYWGTREGHTLVTMTY